MDNKKRKGTTIAFLIMTFIVLQGCATMSPGSLAKKGNGQGSKQENSINYIVKGDSEFRSGNLDNALVQYILALELEPKDINLLFKVGTINRLQGNLDAAELTFTRALKINPDHAANLEGLGIVHLKNEKFDQAMEILMPLLVEHPDRWQAISALGVLHDLQGDYKKAQTMFRAAIDVKPESAWLYNNLGYSLYLSNQLEDAREEYLKAIELQPSFNQAWANLALVYTRQGHTSKAKSAFEQIVDSHMASNNIGYLNLLLDDPQAAVSKFEQAIASNPAYYTVAQENLAEARELVTRSRHQSRATAYATRSAKVPSVQSRKISSRDMNKSSVSSSDVRLVQKVLRKLGFYEGKVDGIIGRATKSAILTYRKDNQIAGSSEIDVQLLDKLKVIF